MASIYDQLMLHVLAITNSITIQFHKINWMLKTTWAPWDQTLKKRLGGLSTLLWQLKSGHPPKLKIIG